MWKKNCRQLAEQEVEIASKDAEIARLRQLLRRRLASSHGSQTSEDLQASAASRLEHPLHHYGQDGEEPWTGVPEREQRGREQQRQTGQRRGRAPPVDAFSGEDPEVQFDDWLPGLQRAAEWNGWTEQELLLQLAGHLRGTALQEWNLLSEDSRRTWDGALRALRTRLEPESKTMAAQDFRHTCQGETEGVAEYIRRLERVFKIAYGRDQMSTETREALLHGQLQEGLRYDLMERPAVSGAQTYKELCAAAKNEEKRIAELKKRRHYHSRSSQANQQPTPRRDRSWQPPAYTQEAARQRSQDKPSKGSTGQRNNRDLLQCYTCGKPGHFARDCKLPRGESRGSWQGKAVTKTVHAATASTGQKHQPGEKERPEDFLASSSESDEDANTHVRQVRMEDKGSHARCVRVQVQGVPMFGIIDTGADITIMGGELFKKLAATAKLRKRDLQKPDTQLRSTTIQY